jgi:predicted RNA-binding protein YlqC (UPF0109 family)
MSELKELIEYLAKNLVDAPDEVRVEEIPEGRELVYELRVAPADLGKVIGRQGRTVRALRTLLAASAARTNTRAALEIVE